MIGPFRKSRSVAQLRVGISGSYGGLNLGDEAILQSIVTQLRTATEAVEVTVFSRNPEDTLRRGFADRAVPVRDLGRQEIRREVERLDLFILGGGGILYDQEASRYLREASLAHELSIPVMVYAVSVGPLQRTATRDLVRDVLNQSAVITVRDRQAAQLLEEIGVRNQIHLTADPALLLKPEEIPVEALQKEGLDPDRRLIGFSVREPGPAAPDIDMDLYHRLLANAADFMVDRLDADVVFVPMERQNMDIQHSHAVLAQMQFAQRAMVLRKEYTPGQVMSIVKQFEFAVGMRLHFLIFAANQGIPFVALPYASKVSGFLDDLKLENPVMDRVSVGKLIAGIDRSWDLRAKIGAQIRSRMPELQERARENNRLLIHLIERIREGRHARSHSA